MCRGREVVESGESGVSIIINRGGVFFFKQKTAYEIRLSLVGSEMCIRDRIINLLRELRDEGRVMLVSTHNLGSVPEFCDRTILVKGTGLSHGLTETTFTRKNLEDTFGGVLRHFTLGSDKLHDDEDARTITIFSDDERPLVQYDNKTQRTDPKK